MGKIRDYTVASKKGFTHPVTEQPAFHFPTHDRLHLPSSGIQLMCVVWSDLGLLRVI